MTREPLLKALDPHAGQALERSVDGTWSSTLPAERSPSRQALTLALEPPTRRDLIANFAHDLRTPLTNLSGYLQALQDEVMPPSTEVFTSLGQEVDRLYWLSLSLDELGAGDQATTRSGLDPIDLNQVVDAAIKLSKPGFDHRGIRVELAMAAGLRVQANPDHIAQVLLNLFQNAARYTPEGGAVSI